VLTKEHIFPKFLYRQFPNQTLGFNEKAGKFLSFEAQIKDVCAVCNNGPLSLLDAYAKSQIKDMKCERTFTARDMVEFQYDYQSLVRWLLKVSYNSSRAMTAVPNLVQQCVPFILDRTAAHPPIAFVAVELVQDARIPDDDRASLPDYARNWAHIPSHMFRVGAQIVTRPDLIAILPECCIRFLSINAWYFTICVATPESNRKARQRFTNAWQDLTPDATVLSSVQSATTLQVSRRTSLDLYAAQGIRVMSQWWDYVNADRPSRAR
jgi:hypothetical protein